MQHQLNLPMDLLQPEHKKKLRENLEKFKDETGKVMLNEKGEPVTMH